MRHALVLRATSNTPSVSEISVHGFNGLQSDIDFYEYEASLLSKTAMNPMVPSMPQNPVLLQLE